MKSDCLIEEISPQSNRCGSICIEGDSIWLYLTDTKQSQIESDCWLSNCASATEPINSPHYRDNKLPPPAPANQLTSDYKHLKEASNKWKLDWAKDGNVICALYCNHPIGFIQAGTKTGFARYLRNICSWGHPWDSARYNKLFLKGG